MICVWYIYICIYIYYCNYVFWLCNRTTVKSLLVDVQRQRKIWKTTVFGHFRDFNDFIAHVLLRLEGLALLAMSETYMMHGPQQPRIAMWVGAYLPETCHPISNWNCSIAVAFGIHLLKMKPGSTPIGFYWALATLQMQYLRGCISN